MRKSFNTEGAEFFAKSAKFEALCLLEVAGLNDPVFVPMHQCYLKLSYLWVSSKWP
jgi:hypothetical protein